MHLWTYRIYKGGGNKKLVLLDAVANAPWDAILKKLRFYTPLVR